MKTKFLLLCIIMCFFFLYVNGENFIKGKSFDGLMYSVDMMHPSAWHARKRAKIRAKYRTHLVSQELKTSIVNSDTLDIIVEDPCYSDFRGTFLEYITNGIQEYGLVYLATEDTHLIQDAETFAFYSKLIDDIKNERCQSAEHSSNIIRLPYRQAIYLHLVRLNESSFKYTQRLVSYNTLKDEYKVYYFPDKQWTDYHASYSMVTHFMWKLFPSFMIYRNAKKSERSCRRLNTH